MQVVENIQLMHAQIIYTADILGVVDVFDEIVYKSFCLNIQCHNYGIIINILAMVFSPSI